MRILVINGANLDMLGIREPEIYGKRTYRELVRYIKAEMKRLGVKGRIVRSNYEGRIIEYIHSAYKKYDGIVINAGGYTHTSVSIADAIKAVSVPTAEVHLSDVNSREEFRKNSYISAVAEKTFSGKGFAGYTDALEYFAKEKAKN